MDDTGHISHHGGDHRAAGAYGGGLWFVGFVGALVYYMQHAANAGLVILGILKALVWPAMLVYYVLLLGKA